MRLGLISKIATTHCSVLLCLLASPPRAAARAQAATRTPAAATASTRTDAQEATGVSGRVTDATGAALPGATVTVATAPPASSAGSRTAVTSIPRTTVTDDAGRFVLAKLPAGSYQVTAELSGFKAAAPIAVTVAEGQIAEANFVLDVGGLAESVTVLGERTARSLRDTAASVAVYDGSLLERTAVTVTSDLLMAVPNVVATGTSNLAPAVRGADGTGPAQGADAFFAGTRARLNFQIDGRPASYNEVTFGDVALWDVQQVEVFRGPQSALQGRNAVAGTIMVHTNDPTYQPEAKVQVLGGNQGMRQVSGMVSGPIVSNQVAYRFAIDRRVSESFVHFSAFDTPTEHIDNPGRFEDLTVRGKVRLDPSALPGFSTVVSVNHARHTGPQTDTVIQPYSEHNAASPEMPVFEPRTTGVVAETKWNTGGPVSFEDTLSFTDLHVDRKARPGEGDATVDAHEFLFEPRLRFGARNTGVRGFGGLYFFRANQDEAIDLFGGGAFDDHTTTVAAFGEVTVPVAARIDLTLGARVEREHRRRQGGAGPFAIDFDQTYNVFSPKVDVAVHATSTTTVGVAVSRGYNGGGAGFTFDPPFVSYTFEPEFVWTTEGYARTDLGRVSLTGNVFYSRYRDMQLPFNISPDPTVWSFVVRNAERAVTYGAEAGVRIRPVTDTEVYANLGLLHTDITRDTGSGIEGHELARSPAVSTSFGVRYRHPRGFDASFDAQAMSAYYSSVTNELAGRTDPYALANLQVGYTHARSHTRIFLFVNNLFNADSAILISPAAAAANDTADILRPRRVGIGVSLATR